MNYIRRKIFFDMYGNTKLIKALALAIFMKNNIESSVFKNYSVTKLHEFTGMHITTLTKRMNTLKNMNLVKFIGNNKQHLLFERISSGCIHRNVDVHCIKGSIKDIEKYLTALMIVEIQRHKDFARQTIQQLNNPSSLDELKKAKAACKRYGYGKEYKEYGLSYNTISKKIGVSLQKAFNIVSFAVKNGILEKTKVVYSSFVLNAANASKYLYGYTFFTKNNFYKVYANRYTIL